LLRAGATARSTRQLPRGLSASMQLFSLTDPHDPDAAAVSGKDIFVAEIASRRSALTAWTGR
jgi:hypothetical protein